jgi:hypothetical protein
MKPRQKLISETFNVLIIPPINSTVVYCALIKLGISKYVIGGGACVILLEESGSGLAVLFMHLSSSLTVGLSLATWQH